MSSCTQLLLQVEAEVINKELSDENMKLSEKLESIKDKPISTFIYITLMLHDIVDYYLG